MLALHVAGALERCTTFDARTIDLDALRGMAHKTNYATVHLEDVLELLEADDREPELQEALRFTLRASRRLRTRIRNHWRRELWITLQRGLRLLVKR